CAAVKSPDAVVEPSQAEAQAQGVADAALEAQAAAEEQEQQARAEAAGTLKACVSAYRKGEKAERAGLLLAGKHAGDYIRMRLTLGDKRQGVVQALEGKLAEYSSTAVDANRLVACYHTYRLLAQETGLDELPDGKAGPAQTVPYGHYRDAWVQCV